MRKKVIVDLGVIPYNMVRDSIEEMRYEVVFVGNKVQISNLKRQNALNSVLCYDDLMVPTSLHNLSIDYNDIFNSIIDDYNTLLIAERVNYRRGYRSNHNDVAKIAIMVENAINHLAEIKPKFLFYQACPHNINTWIFANVAEKMGITVYLCNNSIFFWRNFLMKGLRNETIVSLDKDSIIDKYSSEYAERALLSYEKAIPAYELQRLAKRKNKIWSWNTEIKASLNDWRKLIFLPLKYKLYKALETYCRIPDLDKKYIIVFLHYQPERTSMPEGLYFANQWHLINTIHRALPEGYHLYVKEHPSTFTNTTDRFDPRYRNIEFYRNIASLPNTTLVDLSVNSFTLIDKCKCVATITGTVGGEALLRGKPVLVFGNAPYREHKYAFVVRNSIDVSNALEKIEYISSEEIKCHTTSEYIPFVMRNTILGIEDNTPNIVNLYSEEVRNLSIAKLLLWTLENK